MISKIGFKKIRVIKKNLNRLYFQKTFLRYQKPLREIKIIILKNNENLLQSFYEDVSCGPYVCK